MPVSGKGSASPRATWMLGSSSWPRRPAPARPRRRRPRRCTGGTGARRCRCHSRCRGCGRRPVDVPADHLQAPVLSEAPAVADAPSLDRGGAGGVVALARSVVAFLDRAGHGSSTWSAHGSAGMVGEDGVTRGGAIPSRSQRSSASPGLPTTDTPLQYGRWRHRRVCRHYSWTVRSPRAISSGVVLHAARPSGCRVPVCGCPACRLGGGAKPSSGSANRRPARRPTRANRT